VGEAVTEDAGRVLKTFWGVREMGAHLERPLHGGVRGRKGTPNGMLERWWRSSTQRLRSIVKSGGGENLLAVTSRSEAVRGGRPSERHH
jgi:hypothetical protein